MEESQKKTNSLGVVSLVLGIVSLLAILTHVIIGFIVSIPSFIVAIKAFRGATPKAKGMEISGLIMSSIALALCLLFVVLLVIGISIS